MLRAELKAPVSFLAELPNTLANGRGMNKILRSTIAVGAKNGHVSSTKLINEFKMI